MHWQEINNPRSGLFPGSLLLVLLTSLSDLRLSEAATAGVVCPTLPLVMIWPSSSGWERRFRPTCWNRCIYMHVSTKGSKRFCQNTKRQHIIYYKGFFSLTSLLKQCKPQKKRRLNELLTYVIQHWLLDWVTESLSYSYYFCHLLLKHGLVSLFPMK